MNPDISLARETGVRGQEDGAACHSLVYLAQKEMSAFVIAAKELFGSEIVSEAEDRWLEVVKEIDFTMNSDLQIWRKVTIEAASRLADRILLHRVVQHFEQRK
jgi:hypothetical protein